MAATARINTLAPLTPFTLDELVIPTIPLPMIQLSPALISNLSAVCANSKSILRYIQRANRHAEVGHLKRLAAEDERSIIGMSESILNPTVYRTSDIQEALLHVVKLHYSSMLELLELCQDTESLTAA